MTDDLIAALRRAIDLMEIAPFVIDSLSAWEQQALKDHFAGVLAEAKEAINEVTTERKV